MEILPSDKGTFVRDGLGAGIVVPQPCLIHRATSYHQIVSTYQKLINVPSSQLVASSIDVDSVVQARVANEGLASSNTSIGADGMNRDTLVPLHNQQITPAIKNDPARVAQFSKNGGYTPSTRDNHRITGLWCARTRKGSSGGGDSTRAGSGRRGAAAERRCTLELGEIGVVKR